MAQKAEPWKTSSDRGHPAGLCGYLFLLRQGSGYGSVAVQAQVQSRDPWTRAHSEGRGFPIVVLGGKGLPACIFSRSIKRNGWKGHSGNEVAPQSTVREFRGEFHAQIEAGFRTIDESAATCDATDEHSAEGNRGSRPPGGRRFHR